MIVLFIILTSGRLKFSIAQLNAKLKSIIQRNGWKKKKQTRITDIKNWSRSSRNTGYQLESVPMCVKWFCGAYDSLYIVL